MKYVNSLDGVPQLYYFQLMVISFNKIYLCTPYEVHNSIY